MNKINFFAVSILFLFSFTGCATHGLPESSLRAPQSLGSNPGVVGIDNPSAYSRVFAISDVHGMYEPLLALLRAGKVIDSSDTWIAGNALLVITGDSIDKGPQSIEVLNLWIKLQAQSGAAGGGLIHVLGNHEAEFLADPQDDKKAAELTAELQAKNIPISDLTSTQTPRGNFLHGEPVAARVGRWLFCHSGFYPDMTWADFTLKAKDVFAAQNYGDDFLIGTNSILEMKDWEKHKSMLTPVLTRMNTIGLYGVVFGHQPGAFGIQGRSAAKANGRLIKIDNGMPPESGSHPGSLLVFTNPSQMRDMALPQIKVIFPDGSSQDLQPE
jgi:hypothetical protein